MADRYSKIDSAYNFLIEKCKNSALFSLDELANYTGWKDINTHKSKKLNLILEEEKNLYKVISSFNELNLQDFRDLCSQKNDKVEAITRKLKHLNKTISEKLLDKAVAACMSAIEIYNKPDFSYREENFSILIVNAWELLLKAKILKDNHNDMKSIYKFDKKTGTIKTNRAGGYCTKNIGDCLKEVKEPTLRANLNSIIRIRDNSTHFINEYSGIKAHLHSLSTGCLDNFFIATKKWFGKNYSEYNFYVLPITFSFASENQNMVVDELTKNLLKHLERNHAKAEKYTDSEFSYTINLKYSREKANVYFGLTNSNEGVKLTFANNDELRKIYKWDYKDLCGKLMLRYSNFKKNFKFENLRRNILNDQNYCYKLQLDPINPKSATKDIYKPDTIIQYFDKYYIKKAIGK